MPTPKMEIDTPIRSYLAHTLLAPVPSAADEVVRRRNREELYRSLETHTIATSPQPPSRIQVDDNVRGRTNQTRDGYTRTNNKISLTRKDGQATVRK